MTSFLRTVTRALLLSSLAPWAVAETTSISTPDEALTPQVQQQSLTRYRERITQLQQLSGAYDPQLSENLLGLGVAQQQLSRHQEATESLQRAIHISRINQGLYTLEALPALERLIESQSALGEWEEVHNSYQFMLRLHRHHFDDYDAEMLPALNQLVDWHLSAFQLNVAGASLDHLLSAHGYLQQALRLTSRQEEPMYAQQRTLLQRLSLVDYYLATHIPKANEPSFSITSSSDNFSAPAQPRLMFNSYQEGTQALTAAVELERLNPDATSADLARALARLGDWQMLFKRGHLAEQHYLEAFHLLAAEDSAHPALEEIFGQPVALPLIPESIANLQPNDPDKPNLGYLVVRFDVDEQGRARNINLIDSDPTEANKVAYRLRKRLQATRFRPQIRDGFMVSSNDVEFRYDYHY